MDSFFDIYATSLFIAAASIFFMRFRHEDPPLGPYLTISLTCALANWVGENGFALPAIIVLGAASFLLLHITSQPYVEEVSEHTA